MARGWESKAIEEQQSEASKPVVSKERLTTDQIAQSRVKEGILLSRQRVVGQLERAVNPAHRAMLERALEDLDARLRGLG
jgi:hypothetical protein